MKVESDERTLRITAPSGDTLELDKETDRVSLDGSIEYGVLMKLVKTLKRERNKQSFNVEYYDGD